MLGDKRAASEQATITFCCARRTLLSDDLYCRFFSDDRTLKVMCALDDVLYGGFGSLNDSEMRALDWMSCPVHAGYRPYGTPYHIRLIAFLGHHSSHPPLCIAVSSQDLKCRQSHHLALHVSHLWHFAKCRKVERPVRILSDRSNHKGQHNHTLCEKSTWMR